MSNAKWIGAWIGAMQGGVLGMLAGFVFGGMIDSFLEDKEQNNTSDADRDNVSESGNGERNGFLFSLMVLSAHIIKADGKIMHSEMEHMRQFLLRNFGKDAQIQGEDILKHLFEYRKNIGDYKWQVDINTACQEISRNMTLEQRLQLVSFLCDIAKADGDVVSEEVSAIKNISMRLHISTFEVDKLLSLGGNSLEDSYKTLGLTRHATNEEVRSAYRKMALQYHPDRVSTLGEDVREAAKRKFQQINEAKERIYKERGLK